MNNLSEWELRSAWLPRLRPPAELEGWLGMLKIPYLFSYPCGDRPVAQQAMPRL